MGWGINGVWANERKKTAMGRAMLDGFMPELSEITKGWAKKVECKWKHLLPGCGHACMGVRIEGDVLEVECLLPSCNKCKQTHMDAIDADTLAEFTVAVFNDALNQGDPTKQS